MAIKFTREELGLIVEPEVRQFCGPIFFTHSLEVAEGNVTANGSFGLIDTGSKKLLVTCHHVWNNFQEARLKNPNLMMCVCLDRRNPVVLDVSKLIAEDKHLDIVTFDVKSLLPACGNRKFYRLFENPPRKITKGDVLFFVGFPGYLRCIVDGALGFGRSPFGVCAADCNQDGSKFISNISSLNKAADELGGISGCPCFLLRKNRPIQLVGFTSGVSMNILHFTHARCLNRDGTISSTGGARSL